MPPDKYQPITPQSSSNPTQTINFNHHIPTPSHIKPIIQPPPNPAYTLSPFIPPTHPHAQSLLLHDQVQRIPVNEFCTLLRNSGQDFIYERRYVLSRMLRLPWICRGCHNVNSRDSSTCLGCGGGIDEQDLPLRQGKERAEPRKENLDVDEHHSNDVEDGDENKDEERTAANIAMETRFNDEGEMDAGESEKDGEVRKVKVEVDEHHLNKDGDENKDEERTAANIAMETRFNDEGEMDVGESEKDGEVRKVKVDVDEHHFNEDGDENKDEETKAANIAMETHFNDEGEINEGESEKDGEVRKVKVNVDEHNLNNVEDGDENKDEERTAANIAMETRFINQCESEKDGDVHKVKVNVNEHNLNNVEDGDENKDEEKIATNIAMENRFNDEGKINADKDEKDGEVRKVKVNVDEHHLNDVEDGDRNNDEEKIAANTTMENRFNAEREMDEDESGNDKGVTPFNNEKNSYEERSVVNVAMEGRFDDEREMYEEANENDEGVRLVKMDTGDDVDEDSCWDNDVEENLELTTHITVGAKKNAEIKCITEHFAIPNTKKRKVPPSGDSISSSSLSATKSPKFFTKKKGCSFNSSSTLQQNCKSLSSVYPPDHSQDLQLVDYSRYLPATTLSITPIQYDALESLFTTFCRIPLLAQFMSLIHPVRSPVDTLIKVCSAVSERQYKDVRAVFNDMGRVFTDCVNHHGCRDKDDRIISNMAVHLKEAFVILWLEYMIPSEIDSDYGIGVSGEIGGNEDSKATEVAFEKRENVRKELMNTLQGTELTARCLENVVDALDKFVKRKGRVDKLDKLTILKYHSSTYADNNDDKDNHNNAQSIRAIFIALSNLSFEERTKVKAVYDNRDKDHIFHQYTIKTLYGKVRKCYEDASFHPTVCAIFKNRLDRLLGKIFALVLLAHGRGGNQSSIWGYMVGVVWARESENKPFWPALVLGMMKSDKYKEKWHSIETSKNERRMSEKLREELQAGKRNAELAIQRQNEGVEEHKHFYLVEILGVHKFMWIHETNIGEYFDIEKDQNCPKQEEQVNKSDGIWNDSFTTTKSKEALPLDVIRPNSQIYCKAIKEGNRAQHEFTMKSYNLCGDISEGDQEKISSYALLCEAGEKDTDTIGGLIGGDCKIGMDLLVSDSRGDISIGNPLNHILEDANNDVILIPNHDNSGIKNDPSIGMMHNNVKRIQRRIATSGPWNYTAAGRKKTKKYHTSVKKVKRQFTGIAKERRLEVDRRSCNKGIDVLMAYRSNMTEESHKGIDCLQNDFYVRKKESMGGSTKCKMNVEKESSNNKIYEGDGDGVGDGDSLCDDYGRDDEHEEASIASRTSTTKIHFANDITINRKKDKEFGDSVCNDYGRGDECEETLMASRTLTTQMQNCAKNENIDKKENKEFMMKDDYLKRGEKQKKRHKEMEQSGHSQSTAIDVDHKRQMLEDIMTFTNVTRGMAKTTLIKCEYSTEAAINLILEERERSISQSKKKREPPISCGITGCNNGFRHDLMWTLILDREYRPSKEYQHIYTFTSKHILCKSCFDKHNVKKDQTLTNLDKYVYELLTEVDYKKELKQSSLFGKAGVDYVPES